MNVVERLPIEKTVQIADRQLPPEEGGRVNLVGMPLPDMQALFVARGIEPFRARQVWGWLYKRGATDFSVMSNIARPLQAILAEHFVINRLTVASAQASVDGTHKWLFSCPDNNQAETVYIPDNERGTLCISSQVGCTLNCRFCHTGTQLWVRNLTAPEIVGQLLLARDHLGEWPTPTDGRLLTNIVLMGMGEPLYNYENVATAMKVAMDGEGLGFSRRRITLSTSGVVPLMERCGRELGVNLAVSLHAVRDDVRDVIVPLNRKYPIAELLQACRDYPGLSNARRITFEYVMLKGVNDSDADARELVELLKDIPAKVNLIPFNAWPGASYECSSNNRIHAFAEILYQAGLSAPTRKPRGRDILAACGQLKSESERKRRSGKSLEV